MAGAGSQSPDPAIMATPDPFTSHADSTRHRFSNFDAQVFALGPNTSPAQAKRALEAHLAETDRRMEEAGKLGTTLLQQRQELTDRLKEVEKQHQEGELSQELRLKLVEIEKDYNEVARESARAFLPKPRVPSNETAAGSPFVPEGRTGRRSISPSKFEAQATGSPQKFGVPNRKLRNQPQNRIHDIEFAAEISTSLIAQVRNLQGLLSEKEEELRDIKLEKSKLEYDAEGFQQRLKTLDESEGRYKDENWSLETQVHELTSAQREAADREKKLQQLVNTLQAEKNSAQRELDEVKLSHSKLSEEHVASVKQHDTELGAAKRNIVLAETERAAMQRKIEDLTGQNQELAKAVSSQRGRTSDRLEVLGTSDEDFATANDSNTPEHSPPPSPIKGTPRHSLLESETLKTSLGHAQRSIQGLRTNLHREKTEKLELRRMLQEARDEIEKIRADPPVSNRRARKAESRDFKKPPRLLGNPRSTRAEILPVDDPNWEDQPDTVSPVLTARHRRGSSDTFATVRESIEHDNFDTANETSDQAFETANDNSREGTDTEAFHTGAEEFSSDDVETETESPSKRQMFRSKHASFSSGLARHGSLHSTASTDDEYDDRPSTAGSHLTNNTHKFPTRVGRGALRRSRHASEDPSLQSSPATSFVHEGPSGAAPRNLAAELGDFDGSDNESYISATPSRRSLVSRPGSIRGTTASPPPAVPPLPRVIMVDSSTMTERSLSALTPSSPSSVVPLARTRSMNTVVSRSATSEISEGPELDENLAKFPSPPNSPPKKDFSVSTLYAHGVDPIEEPDTHATEMEALKSEHAKELEQLYAQTSAALTATVEALKASHGDDLSRSVEEVKSTHVQALAAIKSGHADAIAQSSADAKAAHEQEIKALQAAHLEKIAQIESENKDAHSQEVEALQAAYTAKIAQMESGIKKAHAAEIEALTAKHNKKLASSKKESDDTHATEIAALVATHAAQIEHAKKELMDSHAKELDSLKTDHTEQIEIAKQGADAAHSDQLEALKAAHLAQIDESKRSMAATHEQELEVLKATHVTQVEQSKKESDAAHSTELAAMVALHSKQLELSRADGNATLARELEALKASHEKQLQTSKAEADATLSSETEALKMSHAQQLETTKNEVASILEQELDTIKNAHTNQLEEHKKQSDDAHATEIATLAAHHAKQLASVKSEGEETLSKELSALRHAHAKELDALRNEHSAAHTQELEGFKAALAKQIESSKTEGDAAHSQQLDSLKAAHAEIVHAHKRDAETSKSQMEALKAAHEKYIQNLNSEHAASKSKEIERLIAEHEEKIITLGRDNAASRSKELDELAAKHASQIEALKSEQASTKTKEVELLIAGHAQEVEALKGDHAVSRSKETDKLALKHESELDALRAETDVAKSRELDDLATRHEKEVEALRAEAAAAKVHELEQLTASHKAEIEALKAELFAAKSGELYELSASHAQQIAALKSEHESAIGRSMEDMAASHAQELDVIRNESEASKAKELEALHATHAMELELLKGEHETSRMKELEDLKSTHALFLETVRTEHQMTLKDTIQNLKASHTRDLDALNGNHSSTQAEALESLRSSHAQQLDAWRAENDAAVICAIGAAQADHEKALEAHHAETLAEKERLLASHALELEALRKELAIRPALGYSSMSAVQTEPIEESGSLRSPKRDVFDPQTPFVKKNKGFATPVIAEDETRQSPSSAAGPETPESQRPFKEMSTNTDARPRKQTTPTADHSSQTALTSDGLDQLLLKGQRRSSHESAVATRGEVVVTPYDPATPSTVRQRVCDTGALSAPEPVPARRPGSARSSLQPVPPLPANHREAIEAARTSSSSGGKGTMGPPLLPASAYKNTAMRPRTPRDGPQVSPTSGGGTPTPRGISTSSTQGYAEVHSPTRMPIRSRQSSVSSFASEIETRFNIRSDMYADAAGIAGPNTDPRMIQAITQTMIGEYLWKYTRKAGRGEMSENRHRRYFWVHPYTRTLYWSDRDPSTAGRTELRAKSVPIEAVRVVTDDNIMPPGLHRKSLVIISPGRTIKFTCTTGQRHETWFNALSYLLLRTGTEGQNDAEEMAGNITQEDVDEFNPQYRRPVSNARSRGPPSLSSYNSRTTRNDSPSFETSMAIPTLTPTHERHSATRAGTLSRFSSRLSSGNLFNSLRGRAQTSHSGNAIYEASEVHDSAEDVRQVIEQQDMESDRLENVRACCDGKHDVGTLSHSAKRGRHGHSHSHSHSHPGPSRTPTPMNSTLRTRA